MANRRCVGGARCPAAMWWVVGASVVGGLASAAIPHSKPHDPQDAWVLTLEDDFEGSQLNTSLWNIRRNESHCAPCEPQLYIADRLSVSNSNLVITTQRDHIIGPGGALYNWSSGWVDTQHNFFQLYGLWEASVKLPSQNATGAWPAFWTLPNSTQCWPTGGEIDIYEYTANPLLNDIFGSYRWGTQCGDDNQVLPGAGYPPLGAPPVDWTGEYHVIGMEWNSSAITFYVDGVAYETKTSTEVILPTAPQYIIFNTAIAWYWMPGPEAQYPTTHMIDWVKVYQYATPAAAP